MEALDVIKNIRPGFGAGTVVSTVYALALEHAEEAFGSSVIRTAKEQRPLVDDHSNGATDVRPNGATQRRDFRASDGMIISCFCVLFQVLIFHCTRHVGFDSFFASSPS